MIPLARYALTAGAAGIVGFASAAYLRPRTVHESHTEYVDRWNTVVQTLTVVDTRTRTVVQRIIEEKRPDGTQITTRENEGTETETRDRSEQKATAEGNGSGKVANVEVVAGRVLPRWSVGILVGTSTHGDRTVGGFASYRLVGPITVGAWGLSSGQFGGSLGVTW